MDLKFRIAPAEVSYEDGKIVAVKDNDILTIRYTDDKTTPTLESPIYNEPFLREMAETLSVVRQYPKEWTSPILLHLSELRLPH